MKKLQLLICLLILCAFTLDNFKDNQLKYSRVRQAYNDKEADMLSLLKNNQLERGQLQIYLRAFKEEKELELWGKNKDDHKYILIKTYKICRTSGRLGPKRKQGDRQIPEGFYYIDRFNPYSNFYLSLGINYPNKSDKILGVKENLGGDIFIHGSCVTIGCLPITDDKIKELYIFCTEARNNGQLEIPITIFPDRLSDNEFERLKNKYRDNSDFTGLWADLKKGYDIFNKSKKLPNVVFLNSGRHEVKE